MKGVNKAISLLSKADKYLVYYDPDIDGLISGFLVCDFLRKRGNTCSYYLNQNRSHGFYLDLDKINGYTIIAVDFSIPEDVIESIVNSGADLINIDHHNIESNTLVEKSNGRNSAVVINNQYVFESEEERFLSGAGVVYNVLCEIDSSFKNDEYKALVGISLLSDVRVIESSLARDILECTYTSEAPIIKRLVQQTRGTNDYTFGNARMDRNFIDYTFSPKINSLFRTNQGDLAVKLILGGGISDAILTESKRYQNELLKYILNNLKGNEYSALILGGIPDIAKPLANNALLSNFIGLACSRVKASGKTTLLYVGSDGIVERGSVRGKYDNVDYLSIFKDFGFKADGHSNAFGVQGTNLKDIDITGLNATIAGAESIASQSVLNNRVYEVVNLSTFTQSKSIAVHNIYVRSCKMHYLKYIGHSAQKEIRGKMTLWKIDGISVKCFDQGLTPDDGYILPMLERGYITYYLKSDI